MCWCCSCARLDVSFHRESASELCENRWSGASLCHFWTETKGTARLQDVFSVEVYCGVVSIGAETTKRRGPRFKQPARHLKARSERLLIVLPALSFLVSHLLSSHLEDPVSYHCCGKRLKFLSICFILYRIKDAF